MMKAAQPTQRRSEQQRDRFSQLGDLSQRDDAMRINRSIPRILSQHRLQHDHPVTTENGKTPPECWFG